MAMYEISVALKYLIPRKRQFSLSIISLVSLFVITLVVWLVLVFLSVTNGIESKWIEKLVALNGPLQITPKEAYWQSYYYKIDSLCSSSDYQLKTLEEKLKAPQTNPYNPSLDEEIPPYWPPIEKDAQGKAKDLVKELFDVFDRVQDKYPSFQAHSYESTLSQMHLDMIRKSPSFLGHPTFESKSVLTQASYLTSYNTENPRLIQTIQKLDSEDMDQILNNPLFSFPSLMQKVTIHAFKTPREGYFLDWEKLPPGSYTVLLLGSKNHIDTILLPESKKNLHLIEASLKNKGYEVKRSVLQKTDKLIFFSLENQEHALPQDTPLIIPEGIRWQSKLLPNSLKYAHLLEDLRFDLSTQIQGKKIYLNNTSPHSLLIADFSIEKDKSPFWLKNEKLNQEATPIYLPKSFHKKGVRAGDLGYFSYTTQGISAQEQRLSYFVAGFFDPGLNPIGNKLILVDFNVTRLLNASLNQMIPDFPQNGIRLDIEELKSTKNLKRELQELLKKANLDRYFHVESYQDYEFSKDFVQQLQSDKTLLTLIAIIIIIVACSNIVSMLILLVNDKKLEIGILRSMGASSKSIAFIFGFCGFFLGFVSCLLGTLAAMITLKNFEVLAHFLSTIQGHNAFNATFFGDTLPSELSQQALGLVLIATSIISLVAGLIPALKASVMKPSDILRR